jgi:hypothetical protein
MEDLLNELDGLSAKFNSNYPLEIVGYNRGVLDAIDLVNKYLALSNVNVSSDIVLNEVKKPCVHPYASVIGEEHGNPYCLQCKTKLYTT